MEYGNDKNTAFFRTFVSLLFCNLFLTIAVFAQNKFENRQIANVEIVFDGKDTNAVRRRTISN